jgi:hypothetical protein
LGQPFAWAKEAERKQGRAFRDKLERVALSLRIDPSALATQMRHESGFSATIRNSIDAKGLIQFIPKTRRGLALKYGVVVSDDAVQQLDAVYYYYLEYKRRLGDWPPPVDVFFATFTSKGLRQPPGFIIFDRDDKAYHLNRGADRDNDGDIDVHESSERFRKYYRLGFAGPYYG